MFFSKCPQLDKMSNLKVTFGPLLLAKKKKKMVGIRVYNLIDDEKKINIIC